MPSRHTTHHGSLGDARQAKLLQESDSGYPDFAAFEVVQTNVGDVERGTVDRWAVEMTWPDPPSITRLLLTSALDDDGAEFDLQQLAAERGGLYGAGTLG